MSRAHIIIYVVSLYSLLRSLVNMAEHKFETKSVQLGYKPGACTNYAIIPPIAVSTAFEQEDPATHRGYQYTRLNNPSREQLEKAISELENSAHTLCFSSGISAISSIIQLLKNGDHIVCSSIIYAGTHRYIDEIISRANVTTTFVDATDPRNIEKALQDNTKLVYLESVSNPLNTVCDIAEIAQIVRKHKDIIFAIDNTFLTPFFARPLELGAHVSVYSLTKYMNGHDDVCMGAVCFNDEELLPRLKYLQIHAGLNPSPFDCFLVFRGLKTLPLRMRQHQKNSIEIAKFLESHPLVIKVMHSWLPSHPMHEVAKKQFSGHSGMVAFYIKGGLKEASSFLKNLKLITMRGSLGGVGSIIEIPTVLSHASIPKNMKAEIGITDNLIRFSVGVENVEDLIADLDQAFLKMKN